MKSDSDPKPRAFQYRVNSALKSASTNPPTRVSDFPYPDVVGRLASDAEWAMSSVECMLARVKKLALIEFELWLAGG